MRSSGSQVIDYADSEYDHGSCLQASKDRVIEHVDQILKTHLGKSFRIKKTFRYRKLVLQKPALWRSIGNYHGHIRNQHSRQPTQKKQGGLQNPSKRFCRFLKASKCVQSLKKRIKNSTEPFEGSAFYPLAEPSLTKPSGFSTKLLTFGTKP